MAVDSGTYADSTSQALSSRRRIAEALIRQGTDLTPIGHWTQGAARLAHALVGGWMSGQADVEERKRDERSTATLLNLPGLPQVGTPGQYGPEVTDQNKPVGAPAATPPPATLLDGGAPRARRAPPGMSIVEAPNGAPVTVNAAAAPRFQQLLADLQTSGIAIDPRTTGGYNPRNIAGTNTPSLHASGNAIDVNTAANPEGSVAPQPQPSPQFDPNNLVDAAGDRPGQTQIPSAIAQALARASGLRWGGDFRSRSPDPMHFEVNQNASFVPRAQPAPAAAPTAPTNDIIAGVANAADPAAVAASTAALNAGQPPPRTPTTPPAAPAAAPGNGRIPPPTIGPNIDPQMAAYIQQLMANPATRQQGLTLYNTLIQRDQQPTDRQRDYDAYRRDQERQGLPVQSLVEWDRANRRASAQTSVQQGEGAESRVLGEDRAKNRIARRDAGLAAHQNQGELQLVRRLMDDPNFYSGAGSNAVLGLRRAAVALGLANPDAVSSVETFQQQAARQVLAGLGGSLGTGISNADRDFISNTVPNLGNTPEGNRAIVAIAEAMNRRKIAIAQLQEQYAAEHGGNVDQGFDVALSQWAASNPPFSDADMQLIRRGSATPAPGTPPPQTGTGDGWTDLGNGTRIRVRP